MYLWVGHFPSQGCQRQLGWWIIPKTQSQKRFLKIHWCIRILLQKRLGLVDKLLSNLAWHWKQKWEWKMTLTASSIICRDLFIRIQDAPDICFNIFPLRMQSYVWPRIFSMYSLSKQCQLSYRIQKLIIHGKRQLK